MGKGKKKPEDSAKEPDAPPPVAPRPGAKDGKFEAEQKKTEKKIKKDGANDTVPTRRSAAARARLSVACSVDLTADRCIV